MRWNLISRFVMPKNIQLKQCGFLLKVCSHGRQYFLSGNGICLPLKVSRSWVSQTACTPWTVHEADRAGIVHAADRTWAVHAADRTSTVHLANRPWTELIRGSLWVRSCTYLNQGAMSLSSISWRNLSTSSPRRSDQQRPVAHKDTGVTSEGTGTDSGGIELKTGADIKINETGQAGDDTAQKLTLYQRFKKTYKEHGKILVVVHLLTSAVWFGSFYTVAKCGVDVVSFMEKLNFSDKIINPFRSGGLGDVAVAYLMYKLATPARYTVTIGGTNLAIRYLRKEGKIPQVAQEDRIRSLYKEGKEHIKKRSRVHMRRLRKKHGMKSHFGHTKDKH